jgi:hypothetical protein
VPASGLIPVYILLTRTERGASNIRCIFVLQALRGKRARPLADDQVPALVPRREGERAVGTSCDVYGMLTGRLGGILRCEDEVRVVVLDDEVRAVGDVVAKAVQIKAVVDVNR